MDWSDRVKESILLTSPEGNEFEALWPGNSRANEKEVGLFKIPGVKGLKVQDLEARAFTYPLTLFFAGPDNDREAERFSKALEESGPWSIVHPVKGTKTLQLLSWKEDINPVDSGNLTVFNTEWIEPLPDSNVLSVNELRGLIENQSNIVDDVSSTQLLNNIRQDKAAEVASVRTGVNNTVMAVDLHLKSLYEQNSEVNSRIISIKRGINDTLAVIPLDILSLAGQMQTLIQLPALAVADVTARMNAYGGMIEEVFTQSPTESRTEDINTVSLQELALTAGLQSIAFIVSTGILTTRNDSLGLINAVSDSFRAVIDNLDSSQELFDNNPIDLQYYSQSESFNSMVLLIAQSLSYLLRTSFDLAIEKRFILNKGKSTTRITTEEYGGLGENDSNLQLFIDSNNLIANDMLYLIAGTEVVVYV